MKTKISFLILFLLPLAVFAQPSPVSDTVWTKEICHFLSDTSVNEVRFSPDGNLIYVGATNMKPFVVRATDGENVREFEGINSVYCIDLSKDGELFAVSSNNKNIIVYNTIDGTIRHNLLIPQYIINNFDIDNYHGIGCHSLSISSDNKYIAGNFIGTRLSENLRYILIWNLETGNFVKEIADNWIEDVRFSPTEPIMAVSHNKGHDGSEPEGIDLYNTLDWNRIKTLKSEQIVTNDIEFSKDGRFLSAISVEPSVDIWDINSKLLYSRINDIKYGSSAVCMVGDNTLLAGGYEMINTDIRKVYIWDIKNRKEVNSIIVLQPNDLSTHNNMVAVADYYNITLLNIDNYVGVSDGNKIELPTQVIPNPVTNSTEISVFLNNPAQSRITIVDNTGLEIEEIFNENLESGPHFIPWHPKNLANGVYYCRITVNNAESTIKIILER